MAPCFGAPGEAVYRAGDEIVVCGQLFHTGTRVLTWMDKGGFNAYSPLPSVGTNTDVVPALRYGNRKVTLQKQSKTKYPSNRLALESSNTTKVTPQKKEVNSEEWDLESLREVVHQLVIHYDGCGTARRCFKVLHDERALSCHFIIDLDGTVYQTLDCKERAWHATTANDCSIGIEICNLGALSKDSEGPSIFGQWYRSKRAHSPPSTSSTENGCNENSSGSVYLRPPDDGNGEPIPTTPGFVGRPAVDQIVHGEVQGQELRQWDFTQEQYSALCKLAATLSTALPRIRVKYPSKRGGGGVATAKLPDEELAGFEGYIGHFHVQSNKVDPGPAFQWDFLVEQVASMMQLTKVTDHS